MEYSNMQFITICCSLLGILFCSHPQAQKLPYAQFRELPIEQRLLGQDRFVIKYKQEVECYQVTALCFPIKGVDREREHEVWARALLHFENKECSFSIYNETFSDSTLYYVNDRETQDGEVLHLDYYAPSEDEFLEHNSPFFFRDVDFDGQKELVVNNWRCGCYGANTYDIYKLNDSFDIPVRLMTEPPFFKLSNRGSEFDSIRKTITVSDMCSNAAEGATRVYLRSERQTILSDGNIGYESYFKLIKAYIWNSTGEREFILQGDSLVLANN